MTTLRASEPAVAIGPETMTAPSAPRNVAPRAAYIHVPFCRHRCGYCNFTVVAGRGNLVEPYLAAIERELSWLATSREVDTLFLGGGTPTQLRGRQLERLLTSVLKWHPLAAGHEFSVEANPADLDQDAVQILAAHGVNRVSLGAQSFDDAKLRLLERDHQMGDIEQSVTLAKNAGIAVSLDLIFGTPGESFAGWSDDLAAALALAPDHISTYGLTYERGADFWRRRLHGELTPLDEETERSLYAEAIDVLTAGGFEHYEVSNFARPGRRCRHNEAYWAGEEYFAAGPGASRYVAGVRETNHRSTTTYLKRMVAGESPVAEREQLAPEARARELLVFAMRRIDGVSRRWFAERTGFDLDCLVGEAVKHYA
ncbi:MAG TPA: radical SAM family heme chaperone HemW, partial [Pirellulales bacterium]|nr:radical SAM family heme chaperone HemW [Pirellulales bacterium]